MKELGSVLPAYLADIVADEGDPTTDINVVVTNVRWVMKAGQDMVDKTRAGKSNQVDQREPLSSR